MDLKILGSGEIITGAMKVMAAQKSLESAQHSQQLPKVETCPKCSGALGYCHVGAYCTICDWVG